MNLMKKKVYNKYWHIITVFQIFDKISMGNNDIGSARTDKWLEELSALLILQLAAQKLFALS